MPARITPEGELSESITSSTDVDSTLSKLQATSFNPIDFLNDVLPPVNPKAPKGQQIQEASNQVQSLVGKLNAYNVRYTNNLTQLTDDILRSGSRLAYEVEILRGDANGLHEALTDTLQDEIQKLVVNSESQGVTDAEGSGPGDASDRSAPQDPEFIIQLRMLGQVRARLEEAINVFGEAMAWPLPPSELSIASSLISVSAPDPGTDNQAKEERAREVTKKLRVEIACLLNSESGGYIGLEAAEARVQELRILAGVWKGTAEERARAKLVDSLAKPVEERRRAMEAGLGTRRPRGDSVTQRSSSVPSRPAASQARNDGNSNEAGGGFMRNLQRLRDEIYLD